MIKLYGFDTINTLKIVMFLMETDVEFEFVPINIRAGAQHTPEFRAVNPAGKVPVLSDGNHELTESNAILLSLASKVGWGAATDPNEYNQLIAWLFYQASTQGPHFGLIEHWSKFAKAPNPAALAQHRATADRLIQHLDGALAGRQFICGDDYSIADIALYPWLHVHDHLGVSLEAAQNLSSWLERIRNRSSTIKALDFFGPISMFRKEHS